MFPTRWRWNANARAGGAAHPRRQGVPPPLQRMDAEDLLAVVFPDQLACAENIAGDREVPDHPLVEQTLRDCLHEAMDIDGLERAAARHRARRADRDRRARPGRALAARAGDSERAALCLPRRRAAGGAPHAGGGSAPLARSGECRGSRAARPAAIAAGARARRGREAQTPDELHDALVVLGFLTEAEAHAVALPRFELLVQEPALRRDSLRGATGCCVAAGAAADAAA